MRLTIRRRVIRSGGTRPIPFAPSTSSPSSKKRERIGKLLEQKRQQQRSNKPDAGDAGRTMPTRLLSAHLQEMRVLPGLVVGCRWAVGW